MGYPAFARCFRHGGWLHKVWWHYAETDLPLSLWRPLCWWSGGHENSGYGACVRCCKPMSAPARNDR